MTSSTSKVRTGRVIGLVSCHKDWLAVFTRVVLPLARVGNCVVFAAPADACAFLKPLIPAGLKGIVELVPGGKFYVFLLFNV
jgi:hypothetical protein